MAFVIFALLYEVAYIALKAKGVDLDLTLLTILVTVGIYKSIR